MATTHSRYPWLSPQREIVFGPRDDEPTIEEIHEYVSKSLKELRMHYRNGREAKNGDKIIQIDHMGKVTHFGILHDATPGNDYCNGQIAEIQPSSHGACMIDCLHIEDIESMLKEKGFEKRPQGK